MVVRTGRETAPRRAAAQPVFGGSCLERDRPRRQQGRERVDAPRSAAWIVGGEFCRVRVFEDEEGHRAVDRLGLFADEIVEGAFDAERTSDCRDCRGEEDTRDAGLFDETTG